jgi:hypothetical protein
MQMKSSYRVLKWMFLVGAMATLGTACVVTSGDGDDEGEGGEGGTDTTTAGKNSTSGSGGTSTAGTSTGGKGGTASAGTSAGGTAAGGEGGSPDTYVPGVCEGLETPSMLRDATVTAADDEFPCRKCLKMQCKEEWSTCYGEAPTSACGSGSTEDAKGQFECIRSCFTKDTSGDDAETVLGNCEGMCLDQCEDDGFATTDTQDLLGCGQDKCLAECFSPE